MAAKFLIDSVEEYAATLSPSLERTRIEAMIHDYRGIYASVEQQRVRDLERYMPHAERSSRILSLMMRVEAAGDTHVELKELRDVFRGHPKEEIG